MLVTEFTRKALAVRREEKVMAGCGYEKITCKWGIGNLWQLDRGYRTDYRIVEAIVGVDGKSVWVKVEKPT